MQVRACATHPILSGFAEQYQIPSIQGALSIISRFPESPGPRYSKSRDNARSPTTIIIETNITNREQTLYQLTNFDSAHRSTRPAQTCFPTIPAAPGAECAYMLTSALMALYASVTKLERVYLTRVRCFDSLTLSVACSMLKLGRSGMHARGPYKVYARRVNSDWESCLAEGGGSQETREMLRSMIEGFEAKITNYSRKPPPGRKRSSDSQS